MEFWGLLACALSVEEREKNLYALAYPLAICEGLLRNPWKTEDLGLADGARELLFIALPFFSSPSRPSDPEGG